MNNSSSTNQDKDEEKGKGVALVTGASQRIGKALALGLADMGYDIGVHYRGSKAIAEETAAEIAKHGVRVAILQADLAVEDEVDALFAETRQHLGSITCLVNNASTFENDDIASMSRDSWDAHIEPNLRAPLRLTQLMAQDQEKRETQGNVINLIDQRVLKLTPQFLSYTVSKTALWTLTQTLAQALAPNVRVNAIAPGPTLRNARQSEEHFQKQVMATPMQRGASLEEMVGAVRFLLETPSLTGQMLALDGGQHLNWQTPDVVGVVE